MTTLAQYACTLAELEGVLPAALERMQAMAEKRGPCVVISDKVTGRFVQLYGGFGRKIALDVPIGGESPNNACAAAVRIAFSRCYRWESLEFFQEKLGAGDYAGAAELARSTLESVLALPLAAELEVEELLSGMSYYSDNATS